MIGLCYKSLVIPVKYRCVCGWGVEGVEMLVGRMGSSTILTGAPGPLRRHYCRQERGEAGRES